MIRKIFTLVVGLLLAGAANAQVPKFEEPDTNIAQTPNRAEPQKKKFVRPKFFDNTYVGGGLGLQFGNYTRLDLSPIIAYQVGKGFMGGVGFSYLYARTRDPYDGKIYQSNMYGGRVFARLIPVRNILSNGDAFFIHAEYEILNVEYSQSFSVLPKRYNVPGYIAGLGYQQAIGRRAFSYLSVLWNFNTDVKYPYYNPLIRFGFLVGL